MILTSVPFRAKLLDTANRIIRSKITIYDTKMAVPSKGIPFQMYSDQTWGAKVLPSGDGYCVMPNLSLSWSYSAPFWMSVDEFSVDTGSCYFNAEENSSSFGVYVFGEGISVDAWLGSSQIISDVSLTHSPSVYASAGSYSVSNGSWYNFRCRFNGLSGIRNGGISVMYTYNYTGNLQTDKGSLRVLNAGVVSPTNAWAEEADITHFDNIVGNRVRNQPTTYSFEVPYGDATNGYMKDGNNFYTNGTARLQEGMLIEIFAGYDLDATPQASQTEGTVDGNTEYIPRFTGHIAGFEIDRSNNILKVNCVDFFGMAESSFCINYPDTTSYWSAGYYLDANIGEPYGLMAPITYDRWGVVPSIKDLFIKAGIPASRFYGMEKGRTSGDNLSNTISSIYDAGFSLEYARYYGTDQANEYVNTFDLGTTVHQAVMKIADTYGYFIDFKPNGDLRFHPQDNATADIDSGNEARLSEEEQGGSGGARETDTAALGGGYWDLTDQNDTIIFSNPTGAVGGAGVGIPATGFSIVFVRDALSGADDNNNLYWQGTASVRIQIEQDGGEVIRTYNYNLRFDTTHFYNDGVSPLVGANPCLIHLDRNLLFGNYNVIVTALSTYDIKVDELWVYHTNASTPVKLLQTYRIVNQIPSLRSMDFQRDIKDIRNDILVVGNRKGIWVAGGGEEAGLDDPDFSELSNNQYTNYNFRSMDVESIYNPNAPNYTGRHLMTYIQEPNINTDNRAKWLSYSILANYKDFDKRVNMDVIGDPEMTIGDPITMLDRLEEDATNLVWINGIRETITKTDWGIGLEVIGKQPFPSYDEAPDYNIEEDWNGQYMSDFTIGDQFGYSRDGLQKGTLNGNHAWTASTINLNENPVELGWEEEGSMVVYVPSSNLNFSGKVRYGVITYTGRTSNSLTGVNWEYVTPAATTDAQVAGDGWKIENIYNPYEQDDYGNFFTVSFRCLVEGNIYIGVKQTSGTGTFSFIAGLSSGGGLDEDFLPKEERVSSGDLITKIWGGVDQSGLTHQVQGEDIDIEGGFFAEPGEYQIIVEYTRAEDNKAITIYSGGYDDEAGNPQNQRIELNRSGVDQHMTSYTFENNSYAVPSPSASNFPQYSPGSTARMDHTTTSTETNTNSVWIAGTDGDIKVNLWGYYSNVSRKHFITYDVNGYRLSRVPQGIGTPQGRVVLDTVVGVSDKKLNDGKAVSWGATNGDAYIFPFNPNRVKFGVINFDNDFDGYVERYRGYTAYNRFGRARGYYIRLIMDIRDASGRRVISRTGAIIGRRPQSNTDLNYATTTMYSDYNWNSVIELYQIPTKLHTDSNYSNNFWPTTTGEYEMPFFEAQTRVPLSWVEFDT